MKCERCQNPLEGRAERWCSANCRKLGLKSLYRKRHKEKVNAYNRQYRKGK